MMVFSKRPRIVWSANSPHPQPCPEGAHRAVRERGARRAFRTLAVQNGRGWRFSAG
jgi:hypothetical protein